MRIEQVRVDIVSVPFRVPLVSGTQTFDHRRAGILTLRADEGEGGRGEFGARAALPIWIEYMRGALEGVPETRLQQPAGG